MHDWVLTLRSFFLHLYHSICFSICDIRLIEFLCLLLRAAITSWLFDWLYFDWYTLCSCNGHGSDSFWLVRFLIRNSYFLLHNPCYGAFILCFYYHFQSSLNDFLLIFHCLRWIQRERSYSPYPLGIDQKREYEQTTEWLNDIKTRSKTPNEKKKEVVFSFF